MREGHHFYQDVRNKNGGGRVGGSLLNSLPHWDGQEVGPGRRHVGCPSLLGRPTSRAQAPAPAALGPARPYRARAPCSTLIGGSTSLSKVAAQLRHTGGGRRSLVAQAAVHGENARSGLGCVRVIQCLVPPYPSPRPRSSMFPKAQVRRILQRVPGKRRFGIYRFLPFFFVLGGTMEWIMINIRVGQETFCK
ncbi:hypothetical protein P7K49_030549 [Saguinus oedipus]|uniref:Small integral membrane protein 4 n=1 Tax=Saguinus oedipus TaxID=9490 RepID=A0ABQ9U2G4_SAGOE|nr:hypothetical protein P7K49_030549 [Saguinus oedipus]